jgi:hypothetical protein
MHTPQNRMEEDDHTPPLTLTNIFPIMDKGAGPVAVQGSMMDDEDGGPPPSFLPNHYSAAATHV